MKLILFVVFCLFMLGCSGGSSDESQELLPPNTNESTETPVVNNPAPEVPTPTPVSPAPPSDFRTFYPLVESNVSFGDVVNLAYEPSTEKHFYGNDSLQFAEYWRADANRNETNLPVVIFIHGGCWSNSFRIDHSYPLATAFALNGFHTWSIEYRATGDSGGGWPGTYQDIETAIYYIATNSGELYSERRIVVIGHSAGGHLALLARSNMTVDFDVVGLAAITNLVTYAQQSGSCSSLAVSFLNGRPVDIPQLYALANPPTSSLNEVVFLFGGGRDGIVGSEQVQFAGIPFRIDEQAGHFDWIHPGTKSFETVLDYLKDLQ